MRNWAERRVRYKTREVDAYTQRRFVPCEAHSFHRDVEKVEGRYWPLGAALSRVAGCRDRGSSPCTPHTCRSRGSVTPAAGLFFYVFFPDPPPPHLPHSSIPNILIPFSIHFFFRPCFLFRRLVLYQRSRHTASLGRIFGALLLFSLFLEVKCVEIVIIIVALYL